MSFSTPSHACDVVGGERDLHPLAVALGSHERRRHQLQRVEALPQQVGLHHRLALRLGLLLRGIEVGAREQPLPRRIVGRCVEHLAELRRAAARAAGAPPAPATRRACRRGPGRNRFQRAAHDVVFHRGPQPVRVQPGDVGLALLTRAVGHDGLALLVHLAHELRRLLARVPEQLLEHVHDVDHQVDRVVPDDHDPRPVGGRLLADLRLADLDRCRGHDVNSTKDGRLLGRGPQLLRDAADRSPLTKRPESFVEYCLASSTASLITTAVGISGSHPSS